MIDRLEQLGWLRMVANTFFGKEEHLARTPEEDAVRSEMTEKST